MNLGQLFKVGGATVAGYGEDKRQMLAEHLAQVQAQRQANKDAIDKAIAERTLRTPVLGDANYAKAQGEVAGAESAARVPAAVAQAQAIAPVEVKKAADVAAATAPVQQATHEANRKTDVANPLPVQPSFSPVVTTAPGGEQHVSTLNTKTGAIADTGVGAKAGSGASLPAGIRTKVAENTSTLATIDEAMKSLDTHPDAVGLSKNLPLVGKYVDQRLDPEGVATRALIANVGSLQIHTRTGANMNIREEPRLAPFVPDASDTPEAIRTKLTQLSKFLTIENDALIGAPSGPSGGKTPAAGAGHEGLSDEEFAKQWAAGKRSWP